MSTVLRAFSRFVGSVGALLLPPVFFVLTLAIFFFNFRISYLSSLYRYTTKLDKSDPEFLRKQAIAARLAREIQSGDGTAANSNIHVQMDRGGGIGSNVSEDQLFSAVQPVGKPGKSSYQPPFRRGRWYFQLWV
jgi:hypothetical protein